MIELFLTAFFKENIALYFFLGICPLISISSDLKAAWQMGVTVTSVMVVTAVINWGIFYLLLKPLAIEYLQLLFFILSIAAVVQFLEIFLDSNFPSVYASFGIFLPLITVNCAILGVSMFSVLREYNFSSSIVFALAGGLGWTLVICMIASLRRRIDMDAISENLGQTGLTMIIAAIMAMTFTGFSALAFPGAI
ncbi:MAG: electron transport complex protein RnfA [Candidatus Rifleibacteriota bacterium]